MSRPCSASPATYLAGRLQLRRERAVRAVDRARSASTSSPSRTDRCRSGACTACVSPPQDVWTTLRRTGWLEIDRRAVGADRRYRGGAIVGALPGLTWAGTTCAGEPARYLTGTRRRCIVEPVTRKRWAWLVAACSVLLLGVGGLGFAFAPSFGWATPFSGSSHFWYRGLEYRSDNWGEPDRVQQLPIRQRSSFLPRLRVGSVFGYFTSSEPIFQPRDPGWTSETRSPHPVRLLVRDGRCLRISMETADLG